MSLKKEIHINVPFNNAFSHFIESFHLWWPREYTWSRELLEKIEIGSKKDDLCSEYGPHGFRCDWGRMIEVVNNKRISFTWQISPKRAGTGPIQVKCNNCKVPLREWRNKTGASSWPVWKSRGGPWSLYVRYGLRIRMAVYSWKVQGISGQPLTLFDH